MGTSQTQVRVFRLQNNRVKKYVTIWLKLLTRQMYSEKTSGVGLKHLLLKYVLSVMFEAVAEFEAVSLAEAVSVLGLGPEQD